MGNLWSTAAEPEVSYATSAGDDDFVEVIKTDVDLIRIELLYMINIDNGLLNVLISEGLLTAHQVQVIQKPSSYYDQINCMIETIMAQAVSDDIMDHFLRVLDQMLHRHVSNYVRAEGRRSVDHNDYWPLYRCPTERSVLEKNFSTFLDLVDTKNGLLDEMCAASCITTSQKRELEMCEMDNKRNESLYFILRRGSLAAFAAFIECLVRTKQHQIASMLAPHLVKNVHPVNKKQKYRLQINRVELINLIETKDNGLLEELVANDCITVQSKYSIQTGTTNAERSSRLLHILERGSEANFETFIRCLGETNQHNASRILSEDGVVVHLIAATRDIGNATQRRKCIADQFMAMLRNGIFNEPFSKEVQEYVNLQQANDVPLIAVQKENGLEFLYLCKSVYGLKYIFEEYASGRLELTLQKLIILLDANIKDADGSIESVDTLQWEPSNYINCVSTLMNLSIIPDVHRLAPQSPGLQTVFYGNKLNIDKVPYEVIEMILLKAAGRLVGVLNRTTQHADLHAVVLLGNVSSLWWRCLTHRKFVRRSLKEYFQHVCRPFPRHPKRVASLQVEGHGNVTAMAELDGKLYIVAEKSNSVKVYSSKQPFSQLEDMTLQELNDPCDVVACDEFGKLYIADRNTQCAIWRVSLVPRQQVENLVSYQWLPLSLSMQNSRLLVTPRGGNSLLLHDSDGCLLNHIEMPDHIQASHAVESPRNTFIVSHYKRFVGETEFEQNGVSEVDVTGRVVCVFDGRLEGTGLIQFCRPHYLILHNNHVIVADTRGRCIIALSSDLRLRRILLHSLKDQPLRMCVGQSPSLFVNHIESRNVDVYRI